MSITPVILGKGRSGLAIAKSLACLAILRPELKIGSPVWLERGASLLAERTKHLHPVLVVSNPHGLHADAILEAEAANYDAILSEKPACVNLEQLSRLREVKTPTAVFHVYRQMWGVQTLKQMIGDKLFGEMISIEGRYWQASTAERALSAPSKDKKFSIKSWKDDPRLSGEFDAYLDVGSHWVDAVSFLYGSAPIRVRGWRSFANADSPHRDSHVQLTMEYAGKGHAFGSISKTVHGATNHFEINLIGTKLSATWQFLKPDELLIGEGRDRRVLTRKESDLGSKQPAFHGMGWLEGYIEIASRLFGAVYQGETQSYPDLQDNLHVLDAMLRAEWQ